MRADDGLLMRSLAHLYARMHAASAAGEGAPRFKVRASYLEARAQVLCRACPPR